MQQFNCPFCGVRPETEFSFSGEAGKELPQPAGEVTDRSWADYLYMRKNSKGASQEVWTHQPCGELFIMTRDTADMRVLENQSLRKDKI